MDDNLIDNEDALKKLALELQNDEAPKVINPTDLVDENGDVFKLNDGTANQ